MCPIGRSYYLMGLSSWIIYGCLPTYPTVATRIPGFLQWIRNKIGKYILILISEIMKYNIRQDMKSAKEARSGKMPAEQ